MRRCADNGHITRGLIITVVYLFTFNVCLKSSSRSLLFSFFGISFRSVFLFIRCVDALIKKQQPNLKKDFPKNAEQNLSRP